jgi:hypothetical protein
VRNEDGSKSLELSELIAESGIFSGNARGPDGFAEGENLVTEVTNLAGVVSTADLGNLYVAPGPMKPLIHEVKLDLQNLRLTAEVESGSTENNPNSNVAWIRAYHRDFPGGYAVLEPVIDFFRYPHRFETVLPSQFGEEHKEDVEVVAYVGPGVYETAVVSIESAEPVTVLRNETVTLTTWADFDDGAFVDTFEWRSPWLRFDIAPPAAVVFNFEGSTSTGAGPTLPGAPVNLTLQMDSTSPASWARFHWNAEYAKLPVGGLDTYRFLSRDAILDRDDITLRESQRVGATGATDVKAGDVLALRTLDGNPAKLYVETVTYSHSLISKWAQCDVRIRYVVFAQP